MMLTGPFILRLKGIQIEAFQDIYTREFRVLILAAWLGLKRISAKPNQTDAANGGIPQSHEWM